MKQLVLLFAAALAAASAAGCEKSSDLAPVMAETKGIVESYQQRATELERRANDLVRRGLAINAGQDEPASHLLTSARTDIEGMKATLRDAPPQLARATGDDKLDEHKKVAELRALRHRIATQLDDSVVKISTRLNAVEAWLSRAESRPTGQPASAPAPAPATAPTDPQTEGAPTGTNRIPEGGAVTGADESTGPKGETGAGGNETASSGKTGTGGGAETGAGKQSGVEAPKEAGTGHNALGNRGGDGQKAPQGDRAGAGQKAGTGTGTGGGTGAGTGGAVPKSGTGTGTGTGGGAKSGGNTGLGPSKR
jgi:hypothetical protein